MWIRTTDSGNSNEEVKENWKVSEIKSEDEMKAHQETEAEGMELMPLRRST
jgi:hypothetical protein